MVRASYKSCYIARLLARLLVDKRLDSRTFVDQQTSNMASDNADGSMQSLGWTLAIEIQSDVHGKGPIRCCLIENDEAESAEASERVCP